MLITKEAKLITVINVFETTPKPQQELIDAWIRFAEAEVKQEPGFIAAALHKSTDGTRVINYAHWRSEADFGCFQNKAGGQVARWGWNATRVDPTPTMWSISTSGQRGECQSTRPNGRTRRRSCSRSSGRERGVRNRCNDGASAVGHSISEQDPENLLAKKVSN